MYIYYAIYIVAFGFRCFHCFWNLTYAFCRNISPSICQVSVCSLYQFFEYIYLFACICSILYIYSFSCLHTILIALNYKLSLVSFGYNQLSSKIRLTLLHKYQFVVGAWNPLGSVQQFVLICNICNFGGILN